jgi:hypothetical protein
MKYASPDPREKINWLGSTPFFGFHALAVAALLIGVDRTSLLLCGVLYFVRKFFITAGYHRYFSHRSFKTGRTMQFLLAFGGTTAVQKGPLWWAAHHRKHHLYADTERDIQRDVPRRRGPVIRRPRVANPLTCPGRVARNGRPAVRVRSMRWRLVPLPCHGMASRGTGLAIGHPRAGRRDGSARGCPPRRSCSTWPDPASGRRL